MSDSRFRPFEFRSTLCRPACTLIFCYPSVHDFEGMQSLSFAKEVLFVYADRDNQAGQSSIRSHGDF